MALYDDVILYLSNTLTERQFISSASTGTPMRYTCTNQQMIDVPLSRDKIVIAKTLEVVKNGSEKVELLLWYRQTQITPRQPTSDVFKASPKKLNLGKCVSMESFLTQFMHKIVDFLAGDSPKLPEVTRLVLAKLPKRLGFYNHSISTDLQVGPKIVTRVVRGKYLSPKATTPVVVREIYITDSETRRRQWHALNPVERALAVIPSFYVFTLLTSGDSTGLIIGEATSRNVKNSSLFWLGAESNGGYSMVINDLRNTSNGSDNRTKVLSGVSSCTVEHEISECLQESIFRYTDSMRRLRLPLLASSARLF